MRVWYDDNPGQLLSTEGTVATVAWEGGGTSTVSRSDLLTDAEYEEINSD